MLFKILQLGISSALLMLAATWLICQGFIFGNLNTGGWLFGLVMNFVAGVLFAGALKELKEED